MSLSVPHISQTSEPLAWWRGERGGIIFQCPNGHQMRLCDKDGGREISAEGEVRFPVRCVVVGCPFHRTIALEGWDQ